MVVMKLNNGTQQPNVNGTNQYGMQSQDYYNQQVYQGQYNYQQPNNGMNSYDYNNQQMPNNISFSYISYCVFIYTVDFFIFL